jgi:DNA primase large subunit
MLTFLSNSLNILLHLATLNMKLTFPFCIECKGERAKQLALASQTRSTTCNFSAHPLRYYCRDIHHGAQVVDYLYVDLQH